jgi:uncharacterized protein (DUF39 family)
MERRATYRAGRIKLTTKIALSVGIGVIVALEIAAIAHYLARPESELTLKVPNVSVRGTDRASANPAGQIKRQEVQRAAPQQLAREQQPEQQPVAKEAMRAVPEQRENEQRPASQASAQVLDEKEREERAWAKFYKRPAYCDNDPTNEHAIQCANEFIRAQRQFREAYVAGKL